MKMLQKHELKTTVKSDGASYKIQHTLNRVTVNLRNLPKEKRGRGMREASILNAFSHLKEELINRSPNGFLCGGFLIYNERGKDKKLESLATYFDTYLRGVGEVKSYSTNRTTPELFGFGSFGRSR